ncbi:MAG TPA: DUF488 family protein [Nitrososphaera sp.]|nr:DUF488 family protein [Nitrososphaera sp.]
MDSIGMTVRTKSIFQPREAKDGIRILITRYYPRGVKKGHFDEWAKQLSPSPDLLFKYKQGQYNWTSFKKNLLLELRESVDSLDAIYALNDAMKSTEITLLCYEKDRQPCHRHLVKDLIEKPCLLWSLLEPEDADDQERLKIPRLIANK